VRKRICVVAEFNFKIHFLWLSINTRYISLSSHWTGKHVGSGFVKGIKMQKIKIRAKLVTSDFFVPLMKIAALNHTWAVHGP